MDLASSKNTQEDITKESGKTVFLTDKEKWSMKMETYMKENFNKEKDMATVTIQLRTMCMRESGKKAR